MSALINSGETSYINADVMDGLHTGQHVKVTVESKKWLEESTERVVAVFTPLEWERWLVEQLEELNQSGMLPNNLVE